MINTDIEFQAMSIFNVSPQELTIEQVEFAKSQIEFTPFYHTLVEAVKFETGCSLTKQEKYARLYGCSMSNILQGKSNG